MAGSGNRTYIEPEAVRGAGDKVGSLLGDMSPFERCASMQTQAGNFDTAFWLQDQIRARQEDLLSHATHLKTICGEIKEGLHGVSDALEQTDGCNAGDLGYGR